MGDPVEDPFALAGTTLERRFAIERVVARGGFGVVYQGRHITLKKPVAIKVLFMPEGMSLREKQVFLESFEQEAQTIAQLEHPAIVRAYDFGIARPPGRRELPWLALEWIDGESLAQRFEAPDASPMTPEDALAILRPVFQGLAFAHARRVAHRDIKPANIMIVGDPEALQAGLATTRLLDFGIAKVMRPDEEVGSGSTRTMAAFSAFSTPYAAPEQKGGLKTGPWTDVHALGLILTQMLTGRPPYPGDDPVTVELNIMATTRPTPALHGVDVGPWEPVIAKAVSLNAPDRFQDAGSFLAALESAMPGAATATTHTIAEAPKTETTPVIAPEPTPAPVPAPPHVPAQAPAYVPMQAPVYAPAPMFQAYAPPPYQPHVGPPPNAAPRSAWTVWRTLALIAGIGVLGLAGLCVIGLATQDTSGASAADAATPNAPPVLAPMQSPAVVMNLVDASATDASGGSWADTATRFRGRDGEAITVTCPAGGAPAIVWGTDVYTDDSSICTAAVHAGRITNAGGTVVIYVRAAQNSYRGSVRNGVATRDFGAFAGSFAFDPNVAGVAPVPAPPGTLGLRWNDSATPYRGRNGELIGVFCPPGGTAGNVWGTRVYTDDSSICTAAVHAGLATFAEGGVFSIEVMPGRSRYRGSSAHGVTSVNFAAFPGSFALVRR
jgi:serine/threonine protein kinase/phage baseplate assembly protein gpV